MNNLTILVYRDGDQIVALHGEDLHSGTVGFGASTTEALRELAKQMEEDGVVEELDSCL
jgi:hypothetical protein